MKMVRGRQGQPAAASAGPAAPSALLLMHIAAPAPAAPFALTTIGSYNTLVLAAGFLQLNVSLGRNLDQNTDICHELASHLKYTSKALSFG